MGAALKGQKKKKFTSFMKPSISRSGNCVSSSWVSWLCDCGASHWIGISGDPISLSLCPTWPSGPGVSPGPVEEELAPISLAGVDLARWVGCPHTVCLVAGEEGASLAVPDSAVIALCSHIVPALTDLSFVPWLGAIYQRVCLLPMHLAVRSSSLKFLGSSTGPVSKLHLGLS